MLPESATDLYRSMADRDVAAVCAVLGRVDQTALREIRGLVLKHGRWRGLAATYATGDPAGATLALLGWMLGGEV